MSGFVYRWTDTSNGMYYIGSHKGTPGDGYVGSGTWFMRAYKLRPESFVREVLYVGEHFRELEEFILEEIDAKNNKRYYNLKNASIGGNTRQGMKNSPEHLRKVSEANKGRTLSKQQKDKISNTLTGRKASIEAKLKMSKSRKGKGNPFYGKKHSEETKAKIRNAKQGQYIGDKLMQELWNANRKSVYCEYLNKVFDSISQCAKALEISGSTVSNMIAGRAKNKYGIKLIANEAS